MTTTNLLDAPVLPPRDVRSLDDFLRVLDEASGHAQLRGKDGNVTEIPSEVYEVLMNVVHSMRAGKAITVAPVNLLLTTQEAADFLGISRPSVVKLLTEREIPYEQPGEGRHRKVRLSDLIDYQARIRVERASHLGTLIRRGAEDGFYSEDTPENYLEVLDGIRKSRKR
jgi:excisionase family DNA binding protein